ncbi:hypothetical protein BJ741DRAFT_604278 [Chytriomyces cf. hyalinus JEL632]|nr:hypothetical protein BJ741DRAFT_604278 [Chytriomyces cf. hyalinus JEL632]
MALLVLSPSFLAHAFAAPVIPLSNQMGDMAAKYLSKQPIARATSEDSQWEWANVVVSVPCTTEASSTSSTLTASSDAAFSNPPQEQPFLRNSAFRRLGESCGGFNAASLRCARGLICVYSDVPSLFGSCQQVIYHQIGESCAGAEFNPPLCAAGLVCVTKADGELHPSGTCQPEFSSGEAVEILPELFMPPITTATSMDGLPSSTTETSVSLFVETAST